MGYEEYVRRVVPYTPGEQPDRSGMIKLNTNENPYPPAPGVARRLKDFAAGSLRLYPDPEAVLLRDALAERYGVLPEQVYVGIGSDDVLSMAFLTFFHSGKPILFPDVTYSFYDVWAQLYQIPYETQPLDENFRIVPEHYRRENGGVIFPNPNAPTGVYESLDTVEEILRANRDVVVIVDEAYIDFGGVSCLALTEKYDNLLVVQTFSKSRSMAGVRIGYAVGNARLIQYMQDVKFSFNSYTLNRLSLELGVEAVKDEAYFRKTVQQIIRTRERVKRELLKLDFTFPDSLGNFVFASHRRIPGRALFEALREKDIYVRYWEKERIDNYLRITIGTEEEMDTLLAALREYPA